MKKDQQVVAILPDRGDRYYANIYSPDFMHEKGLDNEVAGAYPTPIRYGVDVAKRWSYAPISMRSPILTRAMSAPRKNLPATLAWRLRQSHEPLCLD